MRSIFYYFYNINNAKNKTASIMPGAVRFTISTGLTIARPAQTMVTPAIGEAVRPIAPAMLLPYQDLHECSQVLQHVA